MADTNVNIEVDIKTGKLGELLLITAFLLKKIAPITGMRFQNWVVGRFCKLTARVV